jgi:hypothetical protein
VHLVGFYSVLSLMMHGAMSVKFSKELSTVCSNNRCWLHLHSPAIPDDLDDRSKTHAWNIVRYLPDDTTCIPENLRLLQRRRDKMKSQSNILFIRSRVWNLLNKYLIHNSCNLAPFSFYNGTSQYIGSLSSCSRGLRSRNVTFQLQQVRKLKSPELLHTYFRGVLTTH